MNIIDDLQNNEPRRRIFNEMCNSCKYFDLFKLLLFYLVSCIPTYKIYKFDFFLFIWFRVQS